MSIDDTPQSILPFQTDKSQQVEAAAILAVAELERIKETGFINKQLGEKVLFIIKSGYPIWIISRNDKKYLFDGLNSFTYTISYPNIPPAKILSEDLQAKASLIELYIEYLSNYGICCQNPQVNKFILRGLIDNQKLRNGLLIYHTEAHLFNNEIDSAYVLLTPSLSEKAIENNFRELDSLVTSLKAETQNLSELVKLVRQTTGQHKTELDFQLTATTDEANAKISACEKLVNPQLSKINRKYKRKINSLTKAFDKKIRQLEKKRNQANKSVGKAEEKISDNRHQYRID